MMKFIDAYIVAEKTSRMPFGNSYHIRRIDAMRERDSLDARGHSVIIRKIRIELLTAPKHCKR